MVHFPSLRKPFHINYKKMHSGCREKIKNQSGKGGVEKQGKANELANEGVRTEKLTMRKLVLLLFRASNGYTVFFMTALL